MNAILSCLERNRALLPSNLHQVSPRAQCLLKTPRFRASRHVVFLIFPEGSGEPSLVAKLPRLADDRGGIDREARALREIQVRAGDMALSVPRLAGVFDCAGRPALVQTAMLGQLLDPAGFRRDRESLCRDVTSWLIRFHRATAAHYSDRAAWHERHVERPLKTLETALGGHDDDLRHIERARNVLGTLRETSLPCVIAHGDLGHPNLFRLHSGGIGVIDWELSDPHGVPLLDLWFFLSYAAGTRVKASSPGAQLAAFREAFEGPAPWTQRYVESYVRELNIPRQAVAPLFVLTWTKYLSELAQRLARGDGSDHGLGGEADPRAELTNWIRNNRYYAYWRRAVMQAG